MALAEIIRSCTRNGSWPLKQDPSGTAAALITWSSMTTRGVTLPRNRRFSCSTGFAGSVALSMPLGLMPGRPFNPFRRAISSRCSPTIFSSAATLPNSSTSRASSSGRLRSERDGGGGTSAKDRTPPSRGKRKMSDYPRFCPSYVRRSETLEHVMGLVPRHQRIAMLSRMVEAEILPRLAAGKRSPKAAHGRAAAAGTARVAAPVLTTKDDTLKLVRLLLNNDAPACVAFMETLKQRGATPASLYLGIICDAARCLGALWDDDRCHFAE